MKKERTEGLFGIIMAGLGGAIGFEIFALLNYAYFNLAGPHIILAVLLAGVVNLLIMLSYSELGAAIPEVGGEYTYIKIAYGKFLAFIAGCFRWLASIFGAALAAVTFVIQLAYLFSLLSPVIQSAILAQASLIAVIVVAIYGAMEIKGVKKIGNVLAIMLLILITILIVGGLVYGIGDSETLTKGLFESVSGVFAATVYVFPMFFGMRALIAVAATAKKPGKDIPRGLITSALITIPIYFLLAYIAAGAAPPEGAALSIPLLGYAAEKVFGLAGGVLFSIAGIVACLSGLGTSLTVQSSIARGMSRDGYFPKILLAVHTRFKTHYIAVAAGALFIILLSAAGAIPFLAYTASFGSLIVFALVNLSLIKLRKSKPYMDRPFKTPLYPLTPILGVVFSGAMLIAPSFFGDSNAADALISSVGLTVLVVATYYLRMAGRLRLQIAVGGIGIGAGISALVLVIMSEVGLIPPIFPFISNYVLLIAGVLLMMGGILNLYTGSKSKEKSAMGEEIKRDKTVAK